MSEAQAENLITAKGYGECVCFLSEDSASVVVSTLENGLTDSDTARIVEIVMETTGLEASPDQDHRGGPLKTARGEASPTPARRRGRGAL